VLPVLVTVFPVSSHSSEDYNQFIMKRLAFVVAFSLFLSMPMWAQHGGHASSGGHGGGFAGHGGMSAGHSFSGMHSGSGVRSSSSLGARGFSHGSVPSQRGFSSRGLQGRGLRVRTFGSRNNRNNCFGYACRNAFAYGYYDPYWWWGSGSSYDDNHEQEMGLANEMNQQSLDEQSMREGQDQDLRSA